MRPTRESLTFTYAYVGADDALGELDDLELLSSPFFFGAALDERLCAAALEDLEALDPDALAVERLDLELAALDDEAEAPEEELAELADLELAAFEGLAEGLLDLALAALEELLEELEELAAELADLALAALEEPLDAELPELGLELEALDESAEAEL